MKHKRTIRISMLMTAIVAFVYWAVFFYHTGMVEFNDRISPDKVEQTPEIVSVQKGTNRVEYS